MRPAAGHEEFSIALEPGPASLVSAAMTAGHSRVDRVISVFPPGADKPLLVEVTDRPVAEVRFTVPPGLGGAWRVHVKALSAGHVEKDAGPPPAMTSVLSSTSAPREVRLPRDLVNRTLADVLNGLGPRVKIDTKAGCSVTFDGPAAGEFSLPDMKFSIKPLKKWIWQLHLRDLNLKYLEKKNGEKTLDATISVEPGNARYRNGYIRVVLAFEEDGRELEISWAPDADVSSLRATLMVGLGVDDGAPVPEDCDVHMPVKMDFNNVPDGLFDALLGYSKQVQRRLEAEALKYLEADGTIAAIKKFTAARVSKLLSGGKLQEVQVDDEYVRFFYV